MTEEIKDEDIKVSEEKDGTATVEMPGGMISEDSEDQEVQAAEGGEAKNADDGGDEDHPDDTDAVREARRARRKAKKEYVKRVQQEKDERLAVLARENQEIKARLAEMEKRSQLAELGRMDKAIQDEEARMNYAKLKMKEATDNSDGQAFIRAQELYAETKDKLDKLKGYKSQFETQARNQEAGPDPVVQRQAERWMAKNDWYDPEGTDPRSKLAKQIDSQLAKEGWNPATRDYWEELSARLQEAESDVYTDSTDETPRKRGPRSVVTGSERETGGGSSRNTFTLTVDQVRAMKDAGFWDDPKMKAKMIKRYAEQARLTRS